MSLTLNHESFRQLIDQNLAWLKKNTPDYSLERQHIDQCLRFLREIPPSVQNKLAEEYHGFKDVPA